MTEVLSTLPPSLLESVMPINDAVWRFQDGSFGKVWNNVRMRRNPNLSADNTIRALSSVEGTVLESGKSPLDLHKVIIPPFKPLSIELHGTTLGQLKSPQDIVGQSLNKIIQGTWLNPFYVVFLVDQTAYAARLKRTDLSSHNGFFPFVVQNGEQIGLPPKGARLVTNFLVRRQRTV